MAGWDTNPSWNSLESINGGFKFTSIGDVLPSDFNRLVENMQFLYANYLNSEGGELDMKRIYPVGSIYLSLNKDFSPAELFGGTWERLKDRFLLGASDTYAAGAMGGSATHILADNNSPYETMKLFQNKKATAVTGILGVSWSSAVTVQPNGYVIAKAGEAQSTLGYANPQSGQPITHMPPYLAVYMWERTE